MGELCLAESKHCMRIAKKFSRYLKKRPLPNRYLIETKSLIVMFSNGIKYCL